MINYSLENIKILVADDEPIALEGVLNEIKSIFPNAEVMGFRSSSSAYECVKDGFVPDIALLDIELPEYNGISLGNKLKALCPNTNIIFVTGYGDYYKEAMDMHASGYVLKPVTGKKLLKELEDLRHPLKERSDKRVRLRCFGSFQAFVDDAPISFKYKKSNELLAYLTDRNGAMCTNADISDVLWEDELYNENKASYIRNLRQDITGTFAEYGIFDIIIIKRGKMGLNTDRVKCDYYYFLKQDNDARQAYHGEYMSQFSWAEETNGSISIYFFALS